MFQTTVNVVKTDGTIITKIILPVLIWLFVATMTFPLVIALPEKFAIITVPIMIIALVAFFPVTIHLIKRGIKISNQHTLQKTVFFQNNIENIYFKEFLLC